MNIWRLCMIFTWFFTFTWLFFVFVFFKQNSYSNDDVNLISTFPNLPTINPEHFLPLCILFLYTSCLSAYCTSFLHLQLNNAHSLQTDWPHLHHFGTKWNGLCFDEPARPPVAADLQPIIGKMSGGGSLKSALIIALAPLALRCCSGVHIHFESHTPPLIHFRGKMNYLPPTVNTGIMENYKQSVKESAGFSLRAARVIVTPACFQTEISLCGRWKWHWRCIDWCSVVFHGRKSVGFLLFNEGLLRNFQTRKPSLKNTVDSVLLLKVNRQKLQNSTLSVIQWD